MPSSGGTAGVRRERARHRRESDIVEERRPVARRLAFGVGRQASGSRVGHREVGARLPTGRDRGAPARRRDDRCVEHDRAGVVFRERVAVEAGGPHQHLPGADLGRVPDDLLGGVREGRVWHRERRVVRVPDEIAALGVAQVAAGVDQVEIDEVAGVGPVQRRGDRARARRHAEVVEVELAAGALDGRASDGAAEAADAVGQLDRHADGNRDGRCRGAVAYRDAVEPGARRLRGGDGGFDVRHGSGLDSETSAGEGDRRGAYPVHEGDLQVYDLGSGRRHAAAWIDRDLPRLVFHYDGPLACGPAQRDLVEREVTVAAVGLAVRDEVALGVVYRGLDRDAGVRRPRHPGLDEVGAGRHGEVHGVGVVGSGQGDGRVVEGLEGRELRWRQRDAFGRGAGVPDGDGGARLGAAGDPGRPARGVPGVGRRPRPGTTCPASGPRAPRRRR